MIRTRFAPSPTGFLHCGNARTALFSALFAIKHEGAFVLRIEDTDHARSAEDFSEGLQFDLQWFGLRWQEGPGVEGPHGPYRQSSRHDIYVRYYDLLEKKGLIYPCFCTDSELALNRKLQLSRGEPPHYPGTCRDLTAEELAKRQAKGLKSAWRFRLPSNEQIIFEDIVKGPQTFSSNDMGDFIIRRADGSASFFFCNAIDDSLMGITHVLRGEDHLTNTPRQLFILQALDLRTPSYGHLPLILGEDGSPLSKRHGSFSLHDLRKQGYLPIALVNYLARLGHTYDSNQLMDISLLAVEFNTDRLGRAPAHFDVHQLHHWQKLSVLQMNLSALRNWMGEAIFADSTEKESELFLKVMQHNVVFPKEAAEWAAIFWKDEVHFSDAQLAVLKNTKADFFAALSEHLAARQGDLKLACTDMGKQFQVSGKSLYAPVRLALTCREDGPELAHLAELMGLKRMQKRLEKIIELVK
ncbi:MAG: glutamate--tRNA ligase [Gammaproteobacteria bacterium]|nr:glutamate--tRNA ligase [Gammaproteobacteria bacterium]